VTHAVDPRERAHLLEDLASADEEVRRLAVERLDLLQLHCPPTEVYYRPEVFGILDDLVRAGKIQNYGVSVQKVEEAIKDTAKMAALPSLTLFRE
jgi:aryl-alcohol dehydrogenase-like predicted oxidoreductase